MSLCHDPNELHNKIFNDLSMCKSEKLSTNCVEYTVNKFKDKDVPEGSLRNHLQKMDKYINSYVNNDILLTNNSQIYYDSMMTLHIQLHKQFIKVG